MYLPGGQPLQRPENEVRHCPREVAAVPVKQAGDGDRAGGLVKTNMLPYVIVCCFLQLRLHVAGPHHPHL